MLLSETCMLASQESLSNKRLHCNFNIDELGKNNCTNSHTASITKKSYTHAEGYALVCEIEQLLVSSQKSLPHNSKGDNACEDYLCINVSSDFTAHSGDDICIVSNDKVAKPTNMLLKKCQFIVLFTLICWMGR